MVFTLPLMKIEEIKALANRHPFRPFTIEIENGQPVQITQDSDLLFPKRKPNLVIAFTSDGATHIFEAEAVAALRSD
jgi:hypothetical protein